MIDLTNVRAGLRKYNYEKKSMEIFCSCGNTEISTRNAPCSKCNNSYFVELSGFERSKNIGAFYIDSLTVTSIQISRINFTAEIQDEKFVPVRHSMKQTIKYDYLNRNFVVLRNEKPTVWMTDGKIDSVDGSTEYAVNRHLRNVCQFFSRNTYIENSCLIASTMKKSSNINDYDYDTYAQAYAFISGIDKVTSKRFSYIDSDGENLHKALKFLSTEESVEAMLLYEKFIKAGLLVDFDTIAYTKVGANCNFNTPTLRYPDLGKLNKTIGIPKKAVGYIRNNNVKITSSLLNFGKRVREGKVNSSVLLRILSKAEEYNAVPDVIKLIDSLGEFVSEYNFNPERLVEYLFEEIAMYQGITDGSEGIILLRDYIKMSIELGFDYDKYPRSLKREHDVKVVNYNAVKRQRNEKKFIEKVEEYRELEYSNEEYKVIIPETPNDLVNEGSKLHHCIASYSERVADGRSKIVFIRKAKTPDVPFISVELNSEYKFVQARGSYNNLPNESVKNFINSVWLDKVDKVKDSLLNKQNERVHEIESFEF